MLPVERWTIYYADGSTFSSDRGTWAEAPPFGVICVVSYTVDGFIFDERGDDVSLYGYPGSQPVSAVDVTANAVGVAEPLKMGLWTDGETYWRVHDYARREVTP